MKKWVSYLFIFILTVFTLPVKQIGNLLIKKNATEQRIDDASASEIAKQQQQMQEEVLHKCILPSYSVGFNSFMFKHKANKLMLRDCRLIPHFVPDIPTPPPNFC